MLPLKRAFSTSSHSLQVTSLSGTYKFVPCPQPVIDTGCTYCQPPEFPFNKQIDHTRPLRNSTATLYRHLLILNGIPDNESWPRRFEMSPGSIIGDLNTLKRKYTDGYHPSLISMTSLEVFKGDVDVAGIYPDGLMVEIPKDRRKDFVLAFLDGEGEGEEEALKKKELRASFKTRKLTKDYVLICGHTKRDIRCGELGPMIKDEFEKVLPKNKVELGYISHVGGHSFAGNVLIFKKNGDVIWYGRVEPRHVQGIVNMTVLGNEIIEELYRG
ncbi:DEKNAAC105201 [Brettanomyces naardenensis]|uniref:Altered inheritance of mitochondria protein 32 n=1 Tax=Brettanomyces naardenensis TaxID=13370 RepID=A0A448YSP8_BRENA|nr:DEKNAAC105201 [Brettanomyces naardenensis]